MLGVANRDPHFMQPHRQHPVARTVATLLTASVNALQGTAPCMI